MSKLSIVIPVYNNEDNLKPTYAKLKAEVLDKIDDYELILVDDGSQDNSYVLMQQLHEQDSYIKLIKLSRNFGQHQAIIAGYTNASGDCVVAIAADLQDPPELIIQMYQEWKAGYKVVFAARTARNDGVVNNFFAKITYKLMKPIFKNMPQGGIGFSLIDSSVKNLLIQMDEKNSAVFYQVLWMGFKHQFVYYERAEREYGKSTYTFSKKLKLIIDIIMQFSYYPIRLISVIGIIDCIICFTFMSYLIIHKLLGGAVLMGWSSLMVAIMFVSGVQMLTLGIIGEYIWRNFDATRKRPLYIIDEKIG